MAFFHQLMRLDDSIINIAFKTKHIINVNRPSLLAIKRKMNAMPLEGVGKELFIILNGPSLKSQDLTKLKGKTLMFVNRGFLHPLYKELQPKYHVFVDTKLLSGVWPVEWLDKIWELSPQTKIVLPLEWYNNPIFARFREESRIYWLDWEIPFYGIGVSASCFSFAIKQKFETIYFTGFDANGLAYDMIKSSENSHFYGGDAELKNMTCDQFALALYSHSIHLRSLIRFARYCEKRNISIINITNGGLLDMFPRKNLL